IFTIPGNLAGGVGAAQKFSAGTGFGQEYNDNRYWEGLVWVTLANNGQVTITFNINKVINDTVDFLPGDAGAGIEQVVTQSMIFLENLGQAFDVPFQAKYRDDRFTTQTFTIDVNPPKCPDPDRPPKPDHHDDDHHTDPVRSHDPNDLAGPTGFISPTS